MKIWTVLRRSVQLWAQNFADLMCAYLLEGVLRAFCFVPLLFLLQPEMAFLAWLCIPLYVLIALPARQNYALALQDLLHGGQVFSVRLISTDDYLKKLGRGLLGTLKMLCWMALPLLAILVLAEVYTGKGALAPAVMGLWGVTSRDGLTATRWFSTFGYDAVDGLSHLLLGAAVLWVLPVIGCAVHCGARHAHALEDKLLLKGAHLNLFLLWGLGLLFFLPFAAITLYTLGNNLPLFITGFAKMYLEKNIALPALGERLYLLLGAFVVLFLPVVPLKQLIPAVALDERAKTVYKEIKTNAAP
ncbi:MAG: hypothetical protein IKK57_09815 [Clostridia bacterium]|nr:hypothetical protein [Clostridia bacterium]